MDLIPLYKRGFPITKNIVIGTTATKVIPETPPQYENISSWSITNVSTDGSTVSYTKDGSTPVAGTGSQLAPTQQNGEDNSGGFKPTNKGVWVIGSSASTTIAVSAQ